VDCTKSSSNKAVTKHCGWRIQYVIACMVVFVDACCFGFGFGVFNTGLFVSPWLRCNCRVELIICEIHIGE